MDRKVIIGMCVSAVLFACCTGKPKKAAVEEQEEDLSWLKDLMA